MITCENMTEKNTFFEELKKRRINRGWSQKQLAIRTGLTRDQIASYETRSEPPLSAFLKICKAFGIDVFK